MILYIKCLCGYNKLLAIKYSRMGYDIRETSKNRTWRQEAVSYKAKLPFIVIKGIPEEV